MRERLEGEAEGRGQEVMGEGGGGRVLIGRRRGVVVMGGGGGGGGGDRTCRAGTC